MVRSGSVLPALTVAGVLFGLAGSAPAGVFEQHHHFHAVSGEPVLVGAHAVTNRRCQPGGTPLITANPPPAHGTLTLSPGSHVITQSVGSNQCAGRLVADTDVFYTSAPGFHGTDRFLLTIGLGNTIVHDDVTVTVE